MGWVSLLEAVVTLHTTGMGVSRALAAHARTTASASQALAAAWVILRARYGDPAEAMRALRPRARSRRERLVHDTLCQCLDHPGADHGSLLARAQDQLVTGRLRRRRPRRRRSWPTYRRLDPRGRTRLRQ